jgi:hypothetical protein
MSRFELGWLGRHGLAALACALAPLHGLAQLVAADPHGHAHAEPQLDFRQAPRDALLWGELERTLLRREAGRLVPVFTPAVQRLDGRVVSLVGFMTPVDAGGRHARFLLSAKPILCRGCDAAPTPTEIVEVLAVAAQPAHAGQVTMRGKLELVRAEDGLVYRLRGARVVTAR